MNSPLGVSGYTLWKLLSKITEYNHTNNDKANFKQESSFILGLFLSV